MSAPLSPVEKIKTQSRLLRGTLAESVADPLTGALREDDTQLIKFHGSYQQDDRDLREERRLQKLEPAYSFMIRTRLPGGIATPAQWRAMDDVATTFANGTLRLTTRQAFQVHGVVKRELKATIAAMNAALIDTIAACGDVNRNVVASSHAGGSDLEAEVLRWSRRLSEHLLPRSTAYYEIWLDGKKYVDSGDGGSRAVSVDTAHDVEPILGPTYLPRKFKAGIALPPVNDVDVFAQDLGFIAIVADGRLSGFNLVAGGGMGATHGEPATYARLASLIGFLPPERLLEVAQTVVEIQRDFGDRSNRKHARLKYTIDDRGLPWFHEELARRLGGPLAPPQPFRFTGSGDRFGWYQGENGLWQVTLRIPSGRIADRGQGPWRSGLRRIAEVHTGHFRLTPNQNLVIADIATADRPAIEALLREHQLDLHERASPVRRDALACVALPTCPLAMAEAERYLPELVGQLERLLDKSGLAGEPLLARMTGCPNGCARPQLAELALIGKAPGRYNLYVGGDSRGVRMNRLHRENLDETSILTELDRLFAYWARNRQSQERFGDFVHRLWPAGPIDIGTGAGAA
ncbi:MAG: assimilatory sulfite reductase (NADPH) hemoprotein subunit [Sinobacteraceae bacterium]|nr:assimilatory sulfite reductase (NADPH) hemoprotein subunit [Nevskiaceae bacterium]MCP5466241.1 assimilatory sulfite reductase (NADPH) hemoprotein subunit [Nevskiaceae bacterium]MCP5471643.1 assimilatory sulfite reductase (NADPH) hemoprotein subunit [Nevskiaceae bacterium]